MVFWTIDSKLLSFLHEYFWHERQHFHAQWGWKLAAEYYTEYYIRPVDVEPAVPSEMNGSELEPSSLPASPQLSGNGLKALFKTVFSWSFLLILPPLSVIVMWLAMTELMFQSTLILSLIDVVSQPLCCNKLHCDQRQDGLKGEGLQGRGGLLFILFLINK